MKDDQDLGRDIFLPDFCETQRERDFFVAGLSMGLYSFGTRIKEIVAEGQISEDVSQQLLEHDLALVLQLRKIAQSYES